MAPEVTCHDEWLPETGLFCTLAPHGKESMHYAEYHIEYEKVELSGEGQMWWR